MGHWSHQGLFKMMELSIETLQGLNFELRVSPADSISDVKARIYKAQGIPISQQHLVWNSTELDDEFCLQDYDIQDGSIVKLVPTMRVGPINTRRIPIEEPSLRDYADYLSDAHREEIYDKIAGSGSARPLTVIVYQNGDQINLFRIVDRDATSPLSESLSNASMYGMCDEDEEEQEPSKEKCEENDKLHNKMRVLKTKMADVKKPKVKKPHPPVSGRLSGRTRLQRLPSSASRQSLFNKTPCLPPVGQTSAGHAGQRKATAELSLTTETDFNLKSQSADILLGKKSSSVVEEKVNNDQSAMGVPETCTSLPGSASATRKLPESIDSAKLNRLTSVLEDETVSDYSSKESDKRPPSELDALEAILKKAQVTARKTPARKWDFSQDVLLKDSARPTTSATKQENSSYQYKEPKSGRKSRGGLDRLLSDPTGETYGSSRTPTTTGTLEALKESFGNAPSTASTKRGKGGVILESLNPSEVRAMSGMLSSFVNSANSKSRNSFVKDGRIPTPEARRMSARFRMSASRDGHTTPSHRLPPVKQKKKPSKRCALCNKKTGLATSYICRCGSNFCATHRYAESHECTFDYKTEGRKLLEQANPVVTAPKLPKI